MAVDTLLNVHMWRTARLSWMQRLDLGRGPGTTCVRGSRCPPGRKAVRQRWTESAELCPACFGGSSCPLGLGWGETGRRPQRRVHQGSLVVTGQVQRDAFCNRNKKPHYLFKCRFGYWMIPELDQPVSHFLRRPSRRVCCRRNLARAKVFATLGGVGPRLGHPTSSLLPPSRARALGRSARVCGPCRPPSPGVSFLVSL